MSFSQRLKYAMDNAGMSQGALAKRVGMAQSSINKLLNGAGGSRKIVEIASALNVSPEWLSSGKGNEPHSNVVSIDLLKPASDAFRVEVLDVSASAGPGCFMVSDFAESLHAIEFSSDIAKSLFGNRTSDIVKMITVDGDSMSPTFTAGDQVFVDISVRHFETDGVYVFVFGKTFHIKRLQMQGLKLAVLSDNKIYNNWYVREEDEDQLFIMGRVLIHQSVKYNRVG